MASDERIPPALQPYTIRVRPNWVARISGAAVLLLLLFFAVTQYNETRSLNARLDRAEQDRVVADDDRRIATEALAQAREAQEQAAKDRATALEQNGQLIEIALALEDQIARLGVAPDVPRNSVLRLRARTPVAPSTLPQGSATPQSFLRPSANGAGGGRPAQGPAASPASPTSRPSGGAPAATSKPSSTVPAPEPTVDVPIVSITACLPPLVCIR